MKKVFPLAVCIVLAGFFTASAACAIEMYVAAKGGLLVMSDSGITDSAGIEYEGDFDPGFTVAGSVGSRINKNLRIEPEVAYQESDIDKVSSSGVGVSVGGDVTSLSFLVNLYYDFVNKGPYTPFLGAGIGFSRISASRITVDVAPSLYSDKDKDSVMAYHASAGMGWAVSETLTVDFMYRFLATEDPDFSDYEMDFESHNFYVGFRQSF